MWDEPPGEGEGDEGPESVGGVSSRAGLVGGIGKLFGLGVGKGFALGVVAPELGLN